ncbi:mitochondrial carrier domain-containing protein [Radiomyces spectabilis]|uniref:mitochondrial carrier domain-containing protein n=1 Tax=Radiomyces spectabilis TaxID=64574 RepID=UPI00222029DF|nr:mitochondrial carrier domain-containing protein [Radiomyces spectabilis]KAI8372805.1 mitochondrial carrier domain-containing protein [Radiomyces spectabilis]
MEEDYDYESLGNNSTIAQNAMAGALAGIAEHCAMYPVDSIKTRMQVIQSTRPSVLVTATHAAPSSFVMRSGVAATYAPYNPTMLRNLWRGVNSVVLGAGPAHALHFTTYEACKEAFGANRPGHHPFTAAAAGACATLAHDSLMNPFDVIKQRMQLQDSTYKSVRDCARKVYSKEGIAAFYISLPTTLTMSVPYQSIQFATYEYFRKVINPRGDYDPKTHALAGGLAGAVAAAVTMPLDVAKTLLQTRGQNADPRIRNASGLTDAMMIIKERHGFRGFFRGFKPRVLTTMPSAAISWSVYEYFKWFMGFNAEEESLMTL